MIVAVDARNLSAPRGVGGYARELVAALRRAFPDDELRLVAPRARRLVFGASALVGRPRFADLAGSDADVAWLPAPAPVTVGGLPYVLSVHDLSWLERPRDFTAYERAWHAAMRPARLVRGAARAVADAGPTGAQLAARWGVHATVIAPGVRRPDGPPGPNRHGRYL